MLIIRYFLLYGFLGYVLEKLFARATHAKNQLRRCFVVFPLCPVYGLAMLAVLALPREGAWWERALCGGVVCTAVEYAVHWAYERVFGVHFWDYRPTKLDLNGRVCLPFSVAWGFLSLAAVEWVQPFVAVLAARMNDAATDVILLALGIDALYTARLLLTRRDPCALTVAEVVKIL